MSQRSLKTVRAELKKAEAVTTKYHGHMTKAAATKYQKGCRDRNRLIAEIENIRFPSSKNVKAGKNQYKGW